MYFCRRIVLEFLCLHCRVDCTVSSSIRLRLSFSFSSMSTESSNVTFFITSTSACFSSRTLYILCSIYSTTVFAPPRWAAISAVDCLEKRACILPSLASLSRDWERPGVIKLLRAVARMNKVLKLAVELLPMLKARK